MTRPLVLVLMTILLGACAQKYELSERPYPGPTITLDREDQQHLLVVRAPSPGWTFELVRSRPRFEFADVLVQLRKPNPEFFYTQQEVVQRLATRVSVNTPIDVYARVLEFSGKGKGVPFQRVDPLDPTPEEETLEQIEEKARQGE